MTATEARLRANKKWDAENTERLTIKLYKGKTPMKADIKRAAEREGLSMNSFIVECIRDKI